MILPPAFWEKKKHQLLRPGDSGISYIDMQLAEKPDRFIASGHLLLSARYFLHDAIILAALEQQPVAQHFLRMAIEWAEHGFEHERGAPPFVSEEYGKVQCARTAFYANWILTGESTQRYLDLEQEFLDLMAEHEVHGQRDPSVALFRGLLYLRKRDPARARDSIAAADLRVEMPAIHLMAMMVADHLAHELLGTPEVCRAELEAEVDGQIGIYLKQFPKGNYSDVLPWLWLRSEYMDGEKDPWRLLAALKTWSKT